MRNFFAAAVGSVIALVGFAGAASASATIDLIWAQTGTNSIEAVDVSEAITLRVILRAGPAGSNAAGVSVDYSGAVDKTAVVSFMSTCSGALSIPLGNPVNTGTRIEGITCAALFGALGAGQTQQIGTVTFHKDTTGNGTFPFLSDANGPTDDVLNGTGQVISDMVTFNSATLINAPEPGAISLLAMALGALTLAGRGRRS